MYLGSSKSVNIALHCNLFTSLPLESPFNYRSFLEWCICMGPVYPIFSPFEFPFVIRRSFFLINIYRLCVYLIGREDSVPSLKISRVFVCFVFKRTPWDYFTFAMHDWVYFPLYFFNRRGKAFCSQTIPWKHYKICLKVPAVLFLVISLDHCL